MSELTNTHMPQKECLGCGGVFRPQKRIDQAYCSQPCRKRHNNQKDQQLRKGARFYAKRIEKNVRALYNYIKENPKNLKGVIKSELREFGFNKNGPFIVYNDFDNRYYVLGEYLVEETTSRYNIVKMGGFHKMQVESQLDVLL